MAKKSKSEGNEQEAGNGALRRRITIELDPSYSEQAADVAARAGLPVSEVRSIARDAAVASLANLPPLATLVADAIESKIAALRAG